MIGLHCLGGPGFSSRSVINLVAHTYPKITGVPPSGGDPSINAKKTKFMVRGKPQEGNLTLTLQNGLEIEKADDYKFLGAWINTSEKDILVRKALACEACKRLSSV